MVASLSPADPFPMQCMEIHGGNQAIEEFISTPGIDAWVYSRPYEGDATGGDVHYLSLCGGGVVTRLIVADVSGHGKSVADFSTSLRALVRKNINTKSQTQLIRDLNRQFAELAQSRRFATAVIATYLATTRVLTVCNAGHPRPLWYRAASRSWEWMVQTSGEPGNLPLGIDDETPYNQFATTLGAGDIVLFYTDALTEAAASSGRLLGEEGLLDCVQRLDPASPRTIGPALLNAIEQYREGRPANDDLTLVTLHHNANGPGRLSLGQKLDVYAKVFRLKAY